VLRDGRIGRAHVLRTDADADRSCGERIALRLRREQVQKIPWRYEQHEFVSCGNMAKIGPRQDSSADADRELLLAPR